jgi:hypothetical protein
MKPTSVIPLSNETSLSEMECRCSLREETVPQRLFSKYTIVCDGARWFASIATFAIEMYLLLDKQVQSKVE